eukprot:582472_1
MNDGQNTIDIQPLIIKFSALTCPSPTRCTRCVKVQTVYEAYHDMGLRMASCDKCEHTLYHTDVVLHCPPNHRHHDGFDLCVKCGQIILRRQQKEQQSILRQVAKDKKRKMAERENNNTDPNMQPPPKKKRKRGRPRKYPLPSPPTDTATKPNPKASKPNQNTNNKMNHNQLIPIHTIHKAKPNPTPQSDARTPAIPRAGSVPNIPQMKANASTNNMKKRRSITHYRDWEEQLLHPQFSDNYIKYLRTAPNLSDNAIKIMNRYASWLDFVRLNEGSEMNILNTLCEFESVISRDAVNHINAQTLKELNNLEQYLTTSDMDYKHIWNNVYTNRTQMNEHNAIAKYASNYMAHNSLHKSLFGDPNDRHSTTSWKEISQMIEQSHFIRDWKLHLIDSIIQKQIDILQSLITQHATVKNSLASNSNVLTPSDLRINIWKRHILKLRNIRMRSNVGLEFPMNVLKYDRTEIDHIAKIAAINGIQQSINDKKMNPSKPALPSVKVNTNLTLHDLLPANLKPSPASLTRLYNTTNTSTNSVSSNATTNTANTNANNSYTPPKNNATRNINNLNGFKHNQQFQQQPQKRQKPKPMYNTANNVQNINHLIQNISNNHNIDINQLIHVLSNAQTSLIPNSKQNAVLQQITAHLLAKQQRQPRPPQLRRELPSFPAPRTPSLFNTVTNIPQLIPQDDDDSSSIEFVKEIPPAPVSSVNVIDPTACGRIIGATPHNIFHISNEVLHPGPRMPLNIPKLRPPYVAASRIDLTNNSPPTISSKT